MRELKSLAPAIADAKKLGLDQEKFVELVSQIRVE